MNSIYGAFNSSGCDLLVIWLFSCMLSIKCPPLHSQAFPPHIKLSHHPSLKLPPTPHDLGDLYPCSPERVATEENLLTLDTFSTPMYRPLGRGLLIDSRYTKPLAIKLASIAFCDWLDKLEQNATGNWINWRILWFIFIPIYFSLIIVAINFKIGKLHKWKFYVRTVEIDTPHFRYKLFHYFFNNSCDY